MTAVDRLIAPDRESSIADQLGLAVHLMIRRGCYLLHPIASIAAWILPPARLRQLHFFRDSHQNAVGYMTWAFLADDVEVRWRSQTTGMWHLSEWNEGDTLWIVDFVALPGSLRACIDQAVLRLGRHGRARYLHRREASQRHTMVELAAVDRGANSFWMAGRPQESAQDFDLRYSGDDLLKMIARKLPVMTVGIGSRVLIGGRHQNRICKIVFKGGFGAENRAPGQDRIFFAPNSLALTAHSSNSTGELQIIASEVEIKSPPWAGLGTLRERCPRPGAGNPRRV